VDRKWRRKKRQEREGGGKGKGKDEGGIAVIHNYPTHFSAILGPPSRNYNNI